MIQKMLKQKKLLEHFPLNFSNPEIQVSHTELLVQASQFSIAIEQAIYYHKPTFEISLIYIRTAVH